MLYLPVHLRNSSCVMKAEATSIWTQSENYYNCLTLRWSLRSRTSSEPQCSRGRAARVCEGRRRARRAQPAPGALNGPPAQRQCPDKTHTHTQLCQGGISLPEYNTPTRRMWPPLDKHYIPNTSWHESVYRSFPGQENHKCFNAIELKMLQKYDFKDFSQERNILKK